MLRKATAELLPPIVRRLWNSMRGISAYTFEGFYPSLEAVPVRNHPHHDPQEVEKTVHKAVRRLNETAICRPS